MKERFDICFEANAFVGKYEHQQIMDWWDEYYYLVQIPSMDIKPSDAKRMDEILTLIKREEDRIHFPSDEQINEDMI